MLRVQYNCLVEELAPTGSRPSLRFLVRAGVPERVPMTMTGHKTRSVFERYHIVSPADLRNAARRLDDAAGTNAGTTAGKAR